MKVSTLKILMDSKLLKPHELLKTAQLLLKTALKLLLEVGVDLVIAPFLLGPQQKCSIPQHSQRKILQHGTPLKKNFKLNIHKFRAFFGKS